MKNFSRKISVLVVSFFGLISAAYADNVTVTFKGVTSGKSAEQRINAQQTPTSTIHCHIVSNKPKIAAGSLGIWLKSDQGVYNGGGSLDKDTNTSIKFTLYSNSIPGFIYLETTPNFSLENNAQSTELECALENVVLSGAKKRV